MTARLRACAEVTALAFALLIGVLIGATVTHRHDQRAFTTWLSACTWADTRTVVCPMK